MFRANSPKLLPDYVTMGDTILANEGAGNLISKILPRGPFFRSEHSIGAPKTVDSCPTIKRNPSIENRARSAPVEEPTDTMSSRYAFTQTVKELRFLFCQTSEHSAAVRLVCPRPDEPRWVERIELGGVLHFHPPSGSGKLRLERVS